MAQSVTHKGASLRWKKFCPQGPVGWLKLR